mgnify:CR=1 FL=1
MTASFDVMNNADLRRLILSYLRTTPSVACDSCGCCLVWDEGTKEKEEYLLLYDQKRVCKACWAEMWYHYRGNPCRIA